jgi:hypothetical protein
VYDRELDGQTLTLFVDGRLWKDSMVMADRETRSLWSHVEGEAKSGKWKGKKLKRFPSELMSWQSWRRAHPDGTVVIFDDPPGRHPR